MEYPEWKGMEGSPKPNSRPCTGLGQGLSRHALHPQSPEALEGLEFGEKGRGKELGIGSH